MNRSPMKPGTTPMKRTAFVRIAGRESKAVAKIQSKGKRPKMTPIRRAARGQECTLQILGVCNGDTATTVLCHSNRLADGKGMGLKAPDTAACFGCSSCHDVLDGRRPRPAGMTLEGLLVLFNYARECTHVVLRAKGLMI